MSPKSANRLCGSCHRGIPEPTGASWSFTLEIEPPSQNDVGGNKGTRVQRGKYRRMRDDYTLLLKARKNSLGIPDATRRRRVFIVREYPKGKRRYDRGNLVGGCKPLLDAMTEAGLLVDDKEKWLEDHYEQRPAYKGGAFIIIEELENET